MGQNRRNFIKTLSIAAATILGAKTGNAQEVPENLHAHDRMGVLVDTTVCIGCRRCEWACKLAHDLPTAGIDSYEDDSILANKRRPDHTALTIVNRYPGIPDSDTPVNVKVQCMHCNEPACVSACIVGAISKKDTGAVVWDSAKCIGCRYCMVACPFQIPAFEYEKAFQPNIVKCDFCIDRTRAGKIPACVEICPVEALTYGKRYQLIELAHKKIQREPQRYVNHVYGEQEVGGSSWLYLAGKEFTELDFPQFGSKAAPGVSESIQHGIFAYFVPPVALYALLGGIMWLAKHRNTSEEEAI